MDDYSRNIDQQLLNAYLNSTYQLIKPLIKIRIGQKNEHLDVFLIDNNATSWSFISAANPQSIQISPAENEKAHLELGKHLDSLKYIVCEGLGIPEKEGWSAEKSYLVLDISKKEALAIGQIFDQKAILFGYVLGLPELIFCK